MIYEVHHPLKQATVTLTVSDSHSWSIYWWCCSDIYFMTCLMGDWNCMDPPPKQSVILYESALLVVGVWWSLYIFIWLSSKLAVTIIIIKTRLTNRFVRMQLDWWHSHPFTVWLTGRTTMNCISQMNSSTSPAAVLLVSGWGRYTAPWSHFTVWFFAQYGRFE